MSHHTSGGTNIVTERQIDGENQQEFCNGNVGAGSPKQSEPLNQAHMSNLLLDVRILVEKCENKSALFTNLPDKLQAFIKRWIAMSVDPKSYGHIGELGNMEDKIRRLESDKDSLILQCNVIGEQVDAQTEKIIELETILRERGNKLEGATEMLHTEELSRHALETHKLDLMAEISSLKLKLSTAEKTRKESDERYLQAQRQMEHLQCRLNERTVECGELRMKVKNGSLPLSFDSSDAEVEKLKKAVEALTEANDEKDKSLDEMRKVLGRYKKLEDFLFNTQGAHVADGIRVMDDEQSDSSRQTSGSSSDSGQEGKRIRSDMPHPNATSTPGHHCQKYGEVHLMSPVDEDPNATLTVTLPSTIMSPGHVSPRCRQGSGSDDAFFLKTPSPASRRVCATSTLPKERQSISPIKPTQSLPRKKGFASFAQTEVEDEGVKDNMAREYKAIQEQKEHKEKKKPKGLKKFFGRLKRSNSQDLDKENLEDFKRSGLRATAGARLGWSKDFKFDKELDIPFSRWDSERIAGWLHSMGLSLYIGNCKAYIKHGGQLLQANMHDLEKELGIRSHYHRKKLYLALRTMQSSVKDSFADLDHNWVTRWLDDIGLPQYKDQFSDARIDGRMLHNLTVEELVGLKVCNALHHVSIKRGIQVLRMNGFQSACLQRRPTTEMSHLQNCPREVMLWTNHRVMEWLRTIDLSEYASNLRGSGVHGALMVLEPRFTAELFAGLLSIPKDKTLLRRHLNTHFIGLIGSETQHGKREFQQSSDYAPLTPSTKIKMGKRGLFKHKRTKSEQDWEDFVCPMNVQYRLGHGKNTNHENMQETRRLTHRRNGSLPRNLDHREMLSRENLLERVPASDV